MGSKLHTTHIFLTYLMHHRSMASSSKAKKQRMGDIHGLKPKSEETIRNHRAASMTADVNDNSESGIQFGSLIPEGQTDDVEAQVINAKNGNHVGKPMKVKQYVCVSFNLSTSNVITISCWLKLKKTLPKEIHWKMGLRIGFWSTFLVKTSSLSNRR